METFGFALLGGFRVKAHSLGGNGDFFAWVGFRRSGMMEVYGMYVGHGACGSGVGRG